MKPVKKADEDACQPQASSEIPVVGNRVHFYTDVTSDTIRSLVHTMRQTAQEIRVNAIKQGLDAEHPPPLHLHIHSYGGSIFAGLAARDAILALDVPVHTHIEGACASAGTLLSLSGAHRTIGPTSYALIHQLSSVHWGNWEQLQDDFKNSKALMKMLRRFYRKHTNLSKKKLRRMLKHDLWMPADKCLKYGLVDEIR